MINTTEQIKEKLEYLRGEIRKECISYGEIKDLEDLCEYIDPCDDELLIWAGLQPEDEEAMDYDY